MKVKMLTLAAGPDGIVRPGSVIEVKVAEGRALIKCGYAVEIDKPKEDKEDE